eukprot:jgi/Psemu1/10798/gm1.10798_g
MDGNSSKTSSSSSNGLVVPEAYLEGLALETFVLEALLKRHRCSHGRTIYFRRMDMVRKRLTMTTTTTNNNNNADRDGAERRSRSRTRPTAMVVVVDAVCRLEALQKDTNQYHREQNRKTASLKRRRQTEDDERWDLQTLIQSSKSKSNNNNNNNNNKQSTETTTPRKIANDLRDLVRVWTVALPELLSRIQHAGNALFKEASRGFFFPFCTTALSALARIRSFLMEIGARGLDKLKELEFSLSDSDSDSTKQQQQQQQQQYGEPKLLLTDDVYKHCMDLFVENQNDHERQKRSILQSATDGSNHQHAIVDRTAILRSLGLTESASASASEFASTGKATSRAAPTTTAMTSDGVVEVDDSNADTNQRKQSEESENNGDDDDDDDDYHTLATTTELQDESGLGELVDDSSEVHSGLDSNSNSNPGHHNDSLDRNMALVQKFRKRKSKNETKQSQQSSNEPDKKPKKKKKSVAEDADTNPKKRKSKTAKDPTKTKKKKKTKKEKGGDFFDDIFG